MAAATEIASELGIAPACEALGLGRATFYRHRHPQRPGSHIPPRPKHPRALEATERQNVLAVLHQDRFVDKAPREGYASLLDEGAYLSSQHHVSFPATGR